MTRMRRAGVLAILAAAAAVVLAGCSGGGSSAPPVASLGASSAPATSASSGTSADPGPGSGISGANGANGGGGTRATIAGNVTPLLNEWGACERGNGDPQQTDPTVDAGGVIHITIPKGAQPAGDLHEQSGTCSQYLAEAQNELRAANPVAPPPDEAEYLKYVNCMRTNGVPDYPYPTGDSTDFYGTGVDPNSPAVERVNQLCGTKLGLPAWWVNGTDIPGSIEVHTAGMPANPTPQACFYRKVDPCPGAVTAPGNGGSGGNG